MGYTIGIDFDGTVVTHEYPRVGRDIGAVPVLKKLVKCGNRLILFTMRSRQNGTLQDAVNWFEENGIKLYGVNTNPTQSEWTDSPKAHCHIYIDDAALGIPKKFDMETMRMYVDWGKVEELLEEEGAFDNYYDEEDENNVNEVKKKMKKINEAQLRNMIAESLKRVLMEVKTIDGGDMMGMWDGPKDGPTNEPDYETPGYGKQNEYSQAAEHPLFSAFLHMLYGVSDNVRDRWNAMLEEYTYDEILDGFKAFLTYYARH